MRNPLDGSTVAIVVGPLAVLGSCAAASRGESAIDDGLNLGMTTVLSALAYRSAKRRVLGLAPSSVARVIPELLAMLLVVYSVLDMN
jgi:hypothetical protein